MADPAPQAVPMAPGDTTPERRRVQRHWRRWVVGFVVLAVLAAGAIVFWRAMHAAPAVRYVTAAVTRGPVTRAVTATGSINPVTTVQVGSYVSGVIQQLSCDFNTQVKKGQLCAKIDPRPYQTVVDQEQANLSVARAQLAKDQATLAYAKLSYQRTVDLHNQNLASQDQLDSAKSTADQAAAQVALDQSTITQHQATLQAAEVNVGYTNIVSPVDGTVVSRNVTVGQTVAASFQTPTLFLIATDLTKMQVDTNVSESDIGGIRVGDTATFTVEAFPDHVFDGSVTEVRQAPQTVQNVVTYDVVISVSNSQLLLKPGMTATARIVIERRDNVLRVPDQALRYRPKGSANAAGAASGAADAGQVWVLRNGAPVAVPVTTGLDDDTNTEIVSGQIAAGDEVVTGEQAARAPSSRPPSFMP